MAEFTDKFSDVLEVGEAPCYGEVKMLFQDSYVNSEGLGEMIFSSDTARAIAKELLRLAGDAPKKKKVKRV